WSAISLTCQGTGSPEGVRPGYRGTKPARQPPAGPAPAGGWSHGPQPPPDHPAGDLGPPRRAVVARPQPPPDHRRGRRPAGGGGRPAAPSTRCRPAQRHGRPPTPPIARRPYTVSPL